MIESYKSREEEADKPCVSAETKPDLIVKDNKQDEKSIIKEDMSSGSVPIRIYFEYLVGAYGTRWVFLALVVAYVAVLLPYLALPFWLQHWAAQDKWEQQSMYYAEVTGLLLGLIAACLCVHHYAAGEQEPAQPGSSPPH